MQIRFLLGPAGSGKTFRCLAEIRRMLRAAPEGLPLLLLAPKQATFQLERQLLDFPSPVPEKLARETGAHPDPLNPGGSSPFPPVAGRRRETVPSASDPQAGSGREDEAPLEGYTRLHILSFERLARFIFDRLGLPFPCLLSEPGRVMVLRSLLERKRGDLGVFRASARLPGFVRQLSGLLRELQQYRLPPDRLESLAARLGGADRLDAKLRDLALMLRVYSDWLKQHQLEDADRLLDLAAEALAERRNAEVRDPGGEADCPTPVACSALSGFRSDGLWLDGFAQMTPQERCLLTVVAQQTGHCTLAFCLDAEPAGDAPWHSPWAPVTETFLRCREDLSALHGATVNLEVLKRDPGRDRFEDPWLRHLEMNWGKPSASAIGDLRLTSGAERSDLAEERSGSKCPGSPASDSHPLAGDFPVRVIACANPEVEAECIAHEIRKYVREGNRRFRDVGVLARSLDPYHDAIRRTFVRYEIPFFLDRREPVAHHALAELTRYTIRMIVHDWEHADWFGALKTGLVHEDDNAIDRLENEALARGWEGGNRWLEPINIPGSPASSAWVEQVRRTVVPPFQRFVEAMNAADNRPTGVELGDALRELWKGLKVPRKLEAWTVAAEVETTENPRHPANWPASIHATVWEQMTEWLRDLELAFSQERLSLSEWLPVVDVGLADLSVGVIPPALDQVLVGAVDRSRNPDLRVVFVPGANEGVFPAPPAPPLLLNHADREALASQQAMIGPGYLQQLGLERYYGYIAFTRARSRLILTCARRDAGSRELNPSSFVGDLQRWFPGLAVEEFNRPGDWRHMEHWSELIAPLLGGRVLSEQPALTAAVPGLQPVIARWRRMVDAGSEEKLPPELAEKVYGVELRTSVSALEDFAACPFEFFVGRGLRADERLEFKADSRERGSFQHEVLRQFHERIRKAGKRWRDIAPAEAQALVGKIGEEVLPTFRAGLLAASQSRLFSARLLIEGLERLVGTLMGWAGQYQFDPVKVETGFGLAEGDLPAWRIVLDGQHTLMLRGRIDRIDLCPSGDAGNALGVVIDYKSSARQLDPVLIEQGIELQLLAYLGALSHFDSLGPDQSVSRIVPAGAFYVALGGGGGSARTRDEEREKRAETRQSAAQHHGRFDRGYLDKFDSRGLARGDQFNYARNKDGSFAKRGNEALPGDDFQELVRRVEEFLRQHGRAIYRGEAAVAPYRWKNKTACDFCRFRDVCRFDPWTQPFRVLRPLESGKSSNGET